MTHFHSIHGPIGFIGCCLTYFIVNTVLVAGAVSLEKRSSLWNTLRTNYLYRNQLTSNGTLFALSPILLLSYLSIGHGGVLLFFLPLVIVKEQNRVFIDLQRATQMLISRERMAAKGEMAAAVAHEMNNYLAVLSGRTQLLQRKFERKGLTDFNRDGEVLWTQIERLARLAKGLLQFSNVKQQVTRFDLNGLCQETVEFLKPQNIFDGVELELDLSPDIGEVEGDAGQIEQILQNLVRNSGQAMRDGDVEKAVIRVRTLRTGKNYVQIEVEDNGPGVPSERKARIFDPGFTTKPDGHGFGLATCYRIMENHHGRIWEDGVAGQGARFRFAWPGKVTDSKTSKAA
jgi:signal transduction histidine kinase